MFKIFYKKISRTSLKKCLCKAKQQAEHLQHQKSAQREFPLSSALHHEKLPPLMTPTRYTFLLLLFGLLAIARPANAQCDIQLSHQTTNVLCFGANNGSINLSTSNGAAPYTYAWSNTQTTEDISGLIAGTYTCTVTDALACTATISASVFQPSALFVNAIGGTLTCQILSLAVQTDVNGGTQPYTYQWSNGSTTANPIVSSPGTYTVTVTDANACTATDQADVNMDQSIPVACFLPPTILTCVSPVVAIDGTCSSSGPNFVYQWTGPGIVGGQNTLIPIVNQPGNYVLVVINTSNGCTSQATVQVLQDFTLPTAVAGPDMTLNCATTSLQLNGAGSSIGPQFSYIWSTPNGNVVGGQATLTPTIDAPGVYTLVVTNLFNGCTDSDNVLVVQDVISPIADAGPDTGFPCGGGTATLDATGSAGAQNVVLWIGPGINAGNQSLLTPIVNLPGIYTLLVTNTINGCTATDQVNVFSGPAIPAQNIVVNHLSCFGGDGAIDLTFNGGVPPYTYQWSNGATSEDLANLNAGTYSVTLTDATPCSHYAIIEVIQNTPITIFKSSTSPGSCALSTGTISLFVNGGTPPYTYLWSNGATVEDLTGLPSGIYVVTVTDALGCFNTQTAPLYSNLGLSAIFDQPTCIGDSDGSIDLSVALGTGPYSFSWLGPNGFTSTSEDPTNLVAGSYAVTVTDVNGCVAPTVYSLPDPPTAVLFASGNTTSCFGSSDGVAVAQVSGGQPPFSFLWSTSQTTQTIANLAAGNYSITVTDIKGCTLVEPNVLIQSPPELAITFVTLSNDCNGAVIAPTVSGGTPALGYQFSWSNGSQDSVLQINTNGDYTLVVTDANGCTNSSSYNIQVNNGFCGLLKGNVFQDLVENCQSDGEPGLNGWIMRAEGAAGTFYGVTDVNGDYNIGVLPGDYTMFVTPPNPLWLPCWMSLPIGTVGVTDTLGGFDFPIKKDMNCPMLWVDITSSNLRRCFSNNFYNVQYCNEGPDQAEDAYVLLTLDAFLTPLSSNLPYTNLGNGVIRFELGDLDVGECGSFYLYVKLSCDAVVGQTHCTMAHIYPDSSCIPPNVQWSGASLHVSSECQADSLRFRIENIGTGNMPNLLDYIVIEDQVMLMSAPVQLDAGEFVIVSVPANGSTWRIEVEQEPFHPGQSRPSVTVEACTTGSTFSTGFVTQFPADDADEFVDIDCTENTGSYDPNDKQGFPKGYGQHHYIRPGTPLEYKIRFQNTGNDTAFTVRIVDTLSAWLDPATVRPGAASHAYTWDLNGAGILSFLFENILLPDSNVNGPASHGFVKFAIDPRTDAPLETVIENTADIYFDFNEAVVTNTTFHRLGEDFVTVGLWQPQQPAYEVAVSPNPFSDAAILEIKGLSRTSGLWLRVTDLNGQTVLEMNSETAVFHLKKVDLPAGVYFFTIEQAGKNVGAGKLAVRG